MMTTHKMTEGRLLVIGDHPVEAAAEVSAEEAVEVVKIVVGVERWKETETIHHSVIRILTDGAHSLQHSSCLQVSTVQTRVAGHISSSKKEVKEKYVCSDSLSTRRQVTKRSDILLRNGAAVLSASQFIFPGITNW
jgi:hypothetical protein